MPVRTGKDRIDQAMAEQQARAAQSRKWLFLREDGETAKIRFLSDIEDASGAGGLAAVARFHDDRVQGQRGVAEPKICSENEECPFCTDEGKPSKIKGFFWMYVYYVDHAEKRDQTRFGGEEWKPVQVNGRTFFRERIEAPRVLSANSRLIKAIMSAFGHDGSLLIRDYSLSRSGAKNSPEMFYQVWPLEQGEFKIDVPALVSLVDYADGRVTLSGEEVTLRGTEAYRAPVSDADLEEYGPPADSSDKAAPESNGEGNGDPDDEFGFGPKP